MSENKYSFRNEIKFGLQKEKEANDRELALKALVCCQNPTLNPMQLSAAVTKYLPDLTPNFVCCRRVEVYDINETVFR